MPYITVKLMEGRSSERIKLLAAKMTEAVCEALDIKPSDVRIEFVELKAGTFAVAGQLLPEIKDAEEGSQDE